MNWQESFDVVKELLRECIGEADGFASRFQLSKDILFIDDGPESRGGMWTEMTFDDLWCIRSGEDRCLAGPALRKPGHAERCVGRDELGSFRGDRFVP